MATQHTLRRLSEDRQWQDGVSFRQRFHREAVIKKHA